MIRTSIAAGYAGGALLGMLLLLHPALAQKAHPDAFTITVPGHTEGSMLSAKNASNDPGCGGGNISPAVQWSHAPKGAKSFAVTIIDPDGGKGLGSVHWVAYGIPANLNSLPAGIGTSSSKDFVRGDNSRGKATYRGPCPPKGENPHHYIVAVYALDLAPGALKQGLSHDQFLAAIKGHSLGETSVVLRYQR